MNDQWTNRLSAYIDGELDQTERESLETHLATCGQCYATLADLREVVARAKSLVDREPANNLWAGIRAGMSQSRDAGVAAVRPFRRRLSLSVPQLLAASIALVLMSGGGAWMALRPQQNTAAPDATVSSIQRSRVTPVATWTGPTDAAIAELQATLAQNEQRMDTSTVRIVRQNLAIIDRAIADAWVALQKDPGNSYLNLHLADTMRRKVELLRRVNEMAAARL